MVKDCLEFALRYFRKGILKSKFQNAIIASFEKPWT